MHARDKKYNNQQPGTSGCQGNSSRKHPLSPLERIEGNNFNQPGPSNTRQGNQQSSQENILSGKGVRSALHGTIYQLKLSILFLQTALDEKYRFQLYSGKKDAEKFDDIIFKYGRDGQYRFLQAKHKSNPEKDKITIGKLLSEDPKEPFNLQKYFISFRRIKQKQQYKEKIKDLTICTNADFSDDIKKGIERGYGRLTNKDERDDILNIGSGKRYEFIFDKNKDIVERLKDASDLKRLAKELAKVVFGEEKPINLTNELFKTYHVPLVREVFDKKSAAEKKWYCEFKENFTKGNNLSEEAELLRDAFEKEASKRDKSNNLWSTASKIKLSVSSTFGEYTKLVDRKSKHVSDEEVKKSLPNDPVIDDEIKEFFEKLIFAVQQPNEEKLGELIQDKIFNSLDDLKDYYVAEMIYNHVQKKMLDWLKKRKSTALSEKDNFFSEGAENVKNIMLSIPDQVYNNYFKDKGISFKTESEELQELKGLLNSKNKKILNFVSSEKNIFLSQAKIWQVKEQGAWELKILLNLKKIGDKKVGNLFKDNLLIIVCKNESKTDYEDIEELYNELADSLKDNEKKVVLITQGDSILASFFEKGYLKNSYEKRLDKTGVRDLNPDYLQNKLLKKTVIFQGQERKLKYLVGIKDEKANNNELSEEEIHKLEVVVNCETLCELISDKDIVVGDRLPNFRDSSSPYYDPYHIDIPREFDYQIMNKNSLENCVKKRNEDKFAFSAIGEEYINNLVPPNEKGKIKTFSKRSSDDKEFFKGRFFVFDTKNPEEDFKELAKRYNIVKVVHWITNIDNKFILKHSSKLSYLREFIKKVSRKKIKDLTDSVVIIAGDPGLGKSTVLTTCSQELGLSSWFIRVNLKDHETKIENAEFEDSEGIIKFFSESTVGLETALAKSLLRYRLKHQGQVVSLLDGYDEITDRNQEKVIQLLKTLKYTKGKGWLTTRLTKQSKVENALGIFSYFLNPLDKEQQKEFLRKFWISKLNNSDQEKENKIKDFTKKLLRHFRELGLMKEKDLVGIVLQARMVAEIFQDECRKYLKSEKFNPSEFRINNLFDLYERFVEHQYDRYFTEKIKICKGLLGKGSQIVLTESYTKAHGFLALKTLFSEDQMCKEFLRDKTHQVFLQDELSSMGLIKNFKDTDIADFVHRTYAEFFMAKLSISMLGKREDDPEYKLIRQFLLENIFFDRNELISDFLEHGIQKKCDNDDLKKKWKEIKDCDLLREMGKKGSLELSILPPEHSNPPPDSAKSEKSLSELKRDVELCMNWVGDRYYYNGGVNLINEFFQKFFKETNIEELKTTLEFLVKAKGNSYLGKANAKFFGNNNIYNAVKHYIVQVKLQNKLTLDMLRSMIKCFKTFEQKLDESNSSTQENEKENYAEKLIDFLSKRTQEELDLLPIEFPLVPEIKESIEKRYSGQFYYWLERDGIELAKRFEILTPKMSRQFCSVLDKPIVFGRITIFDTEYASNILNQLICPIIDMMKQKQLPDVHKLAFIKMFARFTHFSTEHEIDLSFVSRQLETVLKLIDTLLSEQVPLHILESANYLFILAEAGLKLIDTGQGLLILDPESGFRHELSSCRDQIVELIKWKRKNPKKNFNEAYKEVIFNRQVQKRIASSDESNLQALTKKRKVH